MKSNKSMLPIFILIVTFLGACFGATNIGPALTTGTFQPSNALGAGETFAGMQAAMRSNPGTMIMEKGNLLLMAWPRGGEYAFALLGKDGRAVDFNALKVNTLSLSMMIKSLQDGGWKSILPSMVPAAVAKVLGMLTVEMAMTSMRSLPTVFLIPVYILDKPEPKS